MKVLIIQHKRIGDVLVSTILCENVKKAFPNSTVDYLINSNTLPVLENNPYIDHKIVFDTAKYSGIANFIKFLLCERVTRNIRTHLLHHLKSRFWPL